MSSKFYRIITNSVWYDFISNPRRIYSTNAQINPGTSDDNKHSKVHTIKILLESGTSASLVCRDVPHERKRIFKDKRKMVHFGKDL